MKVRDEHSTLVSGLAQRRASGRHCHYARLQPGRPGVYQERLPGYPQAGPCWVTAQVSDERSLSGTAEVYLLVEATQMHLYLPLLRTNQAGVGRQLSVADSYLLQ